MGGWYIDSFIDYIRFERRYSPNTCVAYQKDISEFRDFIESTFEVYGPDKVKQDFIRTWIHSFIQDKRTASTIHRKISSIKSYYKYLLKNNIVNNNPLLTILLPKKLKRLPAFIAEKKLEDHKKEI